MTKPWGKICISLGISAAVSALSACSRPSEGKKGGVEPAPQELQAANLPPEDEEPVDLGPANQPGTTLATNLLDFDNARARCDLNVEGNGEFRISCRAVIQLKTGFEYDPVGSVDGLALNWLAPQLRAGSGEISACENLTAYNQICQVTGVPSDGQATIEVGFEVSHPSQAKPRKETRTVVLPYTVGAVAGFSPYLPLKYKPEVALQSGFSLSDQAQTTPIGGADQPQETGFKPLEYDLQSVRYFQNSNSTTFASACARGAKLFVANWASVYEIAGERIRLYAGTGLLKAGDLSNRLHINLGPDLTLGCTSDAVYVADRQNHVILKLSDDGGVSVVAGSYGTSKVSPDGSLASNSPVSAIENLIVSPQGKIYFAEAGSLSIRSISPDGLLQTVVRYADRGNTNKPLDTSIFRGLAQSFRSRQNGNVPAMGFGPSGELYFYNSGSLYVVSGPLEKRLVMGTGESARNPTGGSGVNTVVPWLRGIGPHPESGLLLVSEDGAFHLTPSDELKPLSKIYGNWDNSLLTEALATLDGPAKPLSESTIPLAQHMSTDPATGQHIITAAAAVYRLTPEKLEKVVRQHIRAERSCDQPMPGDEVSLGFSRGMEFRNGALWLVMADPDVNLTDSVGNLLYPEPLDARAFLGKLDFADDGRASLSLESGCAARTHLSDTSLHGLQNSELTFLDDDQVLILARDRILKFHLPSGRGDWLAHGLTGVTSDAKDVTRMSVNGMLALALGGRSLAAGPVARIARLKGGDIVTLNVIIKLTIPLLAEANRVVNEGVAAFDDLMTTLFTQHADGLGFRMRPDGTGAAEVYRTPGFEGDLSVRIFDVLTGEIAPGMTAADDQSVLLAIPWENRVIELDLATREERIIARAPSEPGSPDALQPAGIEIRDLGQPVTLRRFSNGQIVLAEFASQRLSLLTPAGSGQSGQTVPYRHDVLYAAGEAGTCGQGVLKSELEGVAEAHLMKQSLDIMCKGRPRGIALSESCSHPDQGRQFRKIYVSQKFIGGLAANVFEIKVPCSY